MAGDEDVEMKQNGAELPKEQEIVCEQFEEALELEEASPKKAAKLFEKVVWLEDANGKLQRTKEKAIYHLVSIYAGQRQHKELTGLLDYLKPLFQKITKAKTAKIVKRVIELIGKHCDDEVDMQITICTTAIAWCTVEKRTFLKQRVQVKLAELQLRQNKYKDALKLIGKLVKQVKKFDDKLLMVEIELLESKIHHALQNLPKAKGALTAARSAANSVYCPPLLQAQIDLQAGTLCGEEKDYKTAYSYFYEAFEGYNTINDAKMAVACLKYMLLGKIMLNTPEDVYSLVNGKAGVKYAGVEVEAMRKVADAYKSRSVEAFEQVYTQYKAQLGEDPIITTHLEELRASLLEQNLLRLIEPYSRVEISHVAKLIKLPVVDVISKLSEMILDKKVSGILDQGSGDLMLFEEEEEDKAFATSLLTVKELEKVVDRLYSKAKKVTQ